MGNEVRRVVVKRCRFANYFYTLQVFVHALKTTKGKMKSNLLIMLMVCASVVAGPIGEEEIG